MYYKTLKVFLFIGIRPRLGYKNSKTASESNDAFHIQLKVSSIKRHFLSEKVHKK